MPITARLAHKRANDLMLQTLAGVYAGLAGWNLVTVYSQPTAWQPVLVVILLVASVLLLAASRGFRGQLSDQPEAVVIELPIGRAINR